MSTSELEALQSFTWKWVLPPTYGSNDGATEEEGGSHIPATREVGRKAAHIQAGIHGRHHSLQQRDAIYLTAHLSNCKKKKTHQMCKYNMT